MSEQQRAEAPQVHNEVNETIVNGPLIQAGNVTGDINVTIRKPAAGGAVLTPRSRTPQRLLAVLVVGAGAAWAGLCWYGAVHAGPPAWAGVLVVPPAFALWSYRPGGAVRAADVNHWADSLAESVKLAEAGQHDRLLGGDSERINLRFVRGSVPSREARHAADAGMMFCDSEPSKVPDIADYYRALRPGRLVITGDPGSGKTMLAVQLLLDLIKAREAGDPVPVRVPLAAWDTERPLRDQLAGYLVESYGIPKKWAGQLVDTGRVLPVLDGLDEMDPPLADGSPDPAAPRARALLDKLKRHRAGSEPSPVVITCRSEAYREIAKGTAKAPGLRLRDAAQITIEPLEPPQARAYLAVRASTDPERWDALLAEVGERPKAPLSRLLSTPWRLCMTATVYAEDGDPGELTRLGTADELDRHLLSHYLAATVALHPCGRRTYRTRSVHRWLHRIARYLTTGEGRSRGLLSLPDFWQLTTPVVIAVQLGIAAVLYPATYLFLRISPSLHPAEPGYVRIIACIYGVLGSLMAVGPARRFLSVRRVLRRFPPAVLVGSTVPALGLLMGGRGLFFGAVSAVGLLLVFWQAVAGIAHPGTEVRRPGDLLKDDWKAGVACAFTMAFGPNLLDGLREHAADLNLPYALGATALTLVVFAGPTLRHGVFLLVARGVVPLRLGSFLDWAVDAGILRLAGPFYQFRHRELQEWLAANPWPVEPVGMGGRS